ncbi:MAG: hypothetical protein A3I66_19175 [Burkholderiales bacterium RIFCSPLOWO2_02_FULL_57_36]|nr:MAG: hypothetical protein A3I66_19175 [Burkholderiales bacterium RIFCSPLOWO2_02_FULL_57_36]
MPTVLNTSCATSIVPFNQAAAWNREGNWDEYQYQNARCRNVDNVPRTSSGLLAHKRKCALAYLGKRAQLHGGVCSKMMPRVLTPSVIADLEASNQAKRFSLYPWMETLMNLTAEIERTQDQSANPDNVISLVPVSTYYRNNLRQLSKRQLGTDAPFSRISVRSRLARKLPR